MREVDEALSHAFSRRGAGRDSAVPRPHWASQPLANMPSAPCRESTPLSSTAEDEVSWPDVVTVLDRRCSDRFEAMADRLLEARDRKGLKILLFTSRHRAEGRTTLILALARVLSRRPSRTLLIDADLTGPMLCHTLGIVPEVSLSDVIEGEHSLADALVNIGSDTLSILPMRSPAARPRELLAGAGWSRLMARVRREFDLVLIDGGPLFTGLNARVPHRSVDAAVLVHSRRVPAEGSLTRARQALEAGGIPLLGLAETFV